MGLKDERIPEPEATPRPEARIVQVCFKGHRIELFTLPGTVEVEPGQVVIVEADRGTDAGTLLRCGPGQLSARAGKVVQTGPPLGDEGGDPAPGADPQGR